MTTEATFRLKDHDGRLAERPLCGHFTLADDAVVLAEASVDELTALRLCQSPTLVREADQQAFLIRRVDRWRNAKLLLLTLQRL